MRCRRSPELRCKSRRKPRRLAENLIGASLEQDGGNDQELAGKGDDARRTGFHDTHFLLPHNREPFRSRNAFGSGRSYSQLQR
jgi:hypothetical protein